MTNTAEITQFQETADGVTISEIGGLLLKKGEPFISQQFLEKNPARKRLAGSGAWCAVLFLAIINSPRIIGRRVHQPHKGLARELKRRDIGIGQLLPWHEIKLEVTKPRDIYDGEQHEDVITGRRALHFCRKHLRLCHSGTLTYVREHWRGDPAFGIRRGRYHVTA
jgi:hypothetical protein